MLYLWTSIQAANAGNTLQLIAIMANTTVLPMLPILIMVGTFYKRSLPVMLAVVIALSLFGAAIKSYRAIFLQVRTMPYVEAAQAYMGNTATDQKFDIPSKESRSLAWRLRGSRFNDVIADPAGRVFCGTMATGHGHSGSLYRLDLDGKLSRILGGVGCSNGMGFTPDHEGMYHTDSKLREVRLYSYDEQTGSLTNPRRFFRLPEGSLPDGMTVDLAGNIKGFLGVLENRLPVVGSLTFSQQWLVAGWIHAAKTHP